LVAKHSSLVLVGVVLVVAVVYAARREFGMARAFAAAAGIALVVAAPMFIRNQWLYGSPIYPALAPDLHPLLFELNRATYTPNPRTLYVQTARYAGWAIGLVLAAGVGWALIRRHGSLALGLVGFCLAIYAAGPLQPLLDARHMLPVIITAGALGAILLARELVGRTALIVLVDMALLVTAVWFVNRMPNPRMRLDQPLDALEVYRAVREHVPEGEPVLSLYTYDTFYYTRRPATWPIPWGQKEHPVEMFLTSNCDSVLLALNQHHVRWVLTTRTFVDVPFNGANFPGSFVQCMGALLEQRRVSVPWFSETTALVHVEGP
jgi:hypothetical protein